MVYASDFVALLMKQAGDRYDYSVTAADTDPNPTVFDCAELVRWGCARLGVVPRMPDGSWIQAQHCERHGTLVDVDTATRTHGALLFYFKGNWRASKRPASAHVAVSLGTGSTIEARNPSLGVGVFPVKGRPWTLGGRVPGLRYTQPPPAPRSDQARGLAPAWPGLLYVQPPVMRAKGVRDWQQQMADRGWRIRVDGVYGPESAAVCRGFQQELGLRVDGMVGAQTWNAAWTAPVLSYPGLRG
jgi:cell wall-associated NlpC family hydrolase